jgi:hypothetical protein
LKFCFLIFHLFSFFAFSSLKNIRTKGRGEHKDSFEKASAMLQQPEAVFFSAQSEADANSLTQHYFTIRVRGFRNRVPILPVAGLQSAENPHLPVETVSPGAADAAEPAEVEDEFFDSLALQRWSRPGHGDGPEPPTVVYRKGTSESAPVVILGESQAKLILPCWRDTGSGWS